MNTHIAVKMMCGAASMFLGCAHAAQDQYRIDVLADPSSMTSFQYARDINNAGQIVGIGVSVGSTRSRGFLWVDGRITDIGSLDPTGTYSARPSAISELGVIVGDSPTSGPSLFSTGVGSAVKKDRAFVLDHSSIRDLGFVAANKLSAAYDINSHGHAVGQAELSASTLSPVLWDGTGVRDLGLLSDQPGAGGIATSINDAGQIVGAASAATSTHAFIWSSGALVDLHDLAGLPGDALSWATSINETGNVVGYFSLGDLTRAFHWDGSAVHVLPDLAEETRNPATYASDINASGLIVGHAVIDQENHAVLWDGRRVVNLSNLPEVRRAGWEWLGSASALNDRGQIVGSGLYDGQMRGFLLTPVPEPRSGILVLLGLGMVGAATTWSSRLSRSSGQKQRRGRTCGTT